MKPRLLFLIALMAMTLAATGQTRKRTGATPRRTTTTTAAASWKRQYTKVEKLPKGSFSRVWKGDNCGLVDGKGKVLIPVQ